MHKLTGEARSICNSLLSQYRISDEVRKQMLL